MKISLSIILFLFSLTVLSQDLLVLTNTQTGESFSIQEGKRIRVKLENGEKRSGMLKIDSLGRIRINNLITPLERVVKIKRDPLLLTAAFSVVTGYFAMVSVGIGAIVATFGGEPVVGIGIAVIGGGPLTYATITGVNVMKGFKVSKGWEYSVQLE
jgi:hypothetical protein